MIGVASMTEVHLGGRVVWSFLRAAILRGSIGGASSLQQVSPQQLVESGGCGGRMRRQRANAVRRSLRSCNLLPNDDRPNTYDRSVLRLVVSVANSWGNIRRLYATTCRFAWRQSVNRFSALTPPNFGMWQRTRFEQCLDDLMMSWSTPAPAAQAISSSICSQRFSVSPRRVGALRSTLAEEC